MSPFPTAAGRVRASDGVEIAYDAAGRGGPALVLVHGWAGSRRHWDLQVERFARDRRVVRVDLAGHGDSGTGRKSWTMQAFAADLVAVVDALALGQVILVGHSLGGSVIVAAAGSLRERVAGLIGVDTWSFLGSTQGKEDIESAVLLPDMRADFRAGAARFVQLMCGPGAEAELRDRILDDVISMPDGIAVAILEGMIDSYPPAALAAGLRSLEVPLSAISSEAFRPKDGALFESFGIANVVLSGTGHYVMMERPADFNAELAAALARTAR